jgi:hypothetical protein
MPDLQHRKIPIITSINDIPSTPGEPNHPNDSLLCAYYNSLIDDVENELVTLYNQLSSNNNPLSFTPYYTNLTVDYNYYNGRVVNNISYSKEFTLPEGLSWMAMTILNEFYQINNIEGVEQFISDDVTLLVTLSGDNLETLNINFNANNLPDINLYGLYFELQVSSDGSSYTPYNYIINFINNGDKG